MSESSRPPLERMLSVVVPAYNVADYIEQCLSSILQQNEYAARVRVIVIIDGATDRTEQVVRAFAELHPTANITVVTQENRGLSAARNTGLDRVATPYVAFLDGDDFWLPGFLSAVMPLVEKDDFDILEFDACMVDEQGQALRPLRIASGPADALADVSRRDYARHFLSYTWARVYRTGLARRHPFPPRQRFEDTHTTPWFYGDADRILSLGRPLVAYRQRAGSILKTPTMEDVASLNLAARRAWDRYRDSNDDYWKDIALRSFQQACARVIMLPMRQWRHAVRTAREGLENTHEAGASWIRTLQVRHTLLYVAMLYLKRNSIDRAHERVRRWRHGGRTHA